MNNTTTTATTAATFTVGETYSARSACDHNTVWTFTVAKRSAKFITFTDGKRVGVKNGHQGEWALPLGTFSMAPVIRA
jgi:hypothetical protein